MPRALQRGAPAEAKGTHKSKEHSSHGTKKIGNPFGEQNPDFRGNPPTLENTRFALQSSFAEKIHDKL